MSAIDGNPLLNDSGIPTLGAIADIAMLSRSTLDAEVANHYLDGAKYGLAGSNGSWLSNYYRHLINNHELLSVIFADKRNPFDKKRRMLVTFCKLSLTLFLSAVVDATSKLNSADADNSVANAIVIAIIVGPYGVILDSLAKCSICTKLNTCVVAAKWYGLFSLIIASLVSLVFLGIGIAITLSLPDYRIFLKTFILSLGFDYASYVYMRILNWVLISWEGFLCLPIFPIGSKGFPPRYMPLLGRFPINFLLSLFQWGERTYLEEKAEFQEKYPDRIAIDRLINAPPTQSASVV